MILHHITYRLLNKEINKWKKLSKGSYISTKKLLISSSEGKGSKSLIKEIVQ